MQRDSAPYGEPVALAEAVRRITAPNMSPMTFEGTQSYLLGLSRGPLVLIDPGPDMSPHREAIMAAAGGATIAAILVTHSHLDHTGSVAAMKAATGAEVLAFGGHSAGMSAQMRALRDAGIELGGGEGADRAFAPDRCLADGDAVEIGDVALRAVHTPGHLGNHLAFHAPALDLMFTGDAVMGWSTTLVSPPEGDMAAQMRTLRRLAALAEATPALRLMPGHGPMVEAASALIAEQIAHREVRRAALIGALEHGPGTARALAERLYTDTPPALLPAATRNVFATLLQLEEEGVASASGPPGPDTPYALV